MAEALATLSGVVGAFEESYERGGYSAAQDSEAEFAPVLAAAVDPLLAACERSAEALSPDAPSRCLSCTATTHLLIPSTDDAPGPKACPARALEGRTVLP